MNILWTTEQYWKNDGGGMISSNILVNQLKIMGHDVKVESIEDHAITAPVPFYIRRHLSIKRYVRRLRRVIDRTSPDVIVTQGNIYPWVLDEATRRGIPSTVFIRDYHYACPTAYHGDCPGSCIRCFNLSMLLQAPIIHLHQNRKFRSLDVADLVLVNSQFMQHHIFSSRGINAKVVYPPVDDGHVPKKWDPKYVLFMGNGAWKGIDRVLGLATRHPQFDFLVCGEQHPSKVLRMSLLPNLEYRAWSTRDSAFSGARVVLTPSTWSEPFGRVPIEAGRVGIPTISSDKGGLREAVGYGGMIADDDEDWSKCLERMMTNDYDWERFSRSAIIHSLKFNSETMASMLVHHIEGVLS